VTEIDAGEKAERKSWSALLATRMIVDLGEASAE